MGRYLGPKHRLCRREGVKLCDSPKCPIVRRNYPPGIHGPKRQARPTAYGEQLREKQKAKRLYGILEKQFKNYFKKAIDKKGDTSIYLVQLLEMRLDNVIYRSGFAKTRAQARQMVSHGFFTVNGRKVNIPSYEVKVKDIIAIKKGKENKGVFQDLKKRLEKHEFPDWLHYDPQNMTVKVIALPKVEDMALIFNPQAIVEFYSR